MSRILSFPTPSPFVPGSREGLSVSCFSSPEKETRVTVRGAGVSRGLRRSDVSGPGTCYGTDDVLTQVSLFPY